MDVAVRLDGYHIGGVIRGEMSRNKDVRYGEACTRNIREGVYKGSAGLEDYMYLDFAS